MNAGPDANAGSAGSADPAAAKVRSAGPGGPPGPGDLVVLVDSHSLIYQVFHAMPAMTAPDGTEVGAIHGFYRDLADIRERYDPDFLLACFDVSDITFRSELYADYKAHRAPMPPALVQQIVRIRDGLTPLGIPCVTAAGYEADDLLATFARYASDCGADVLLVTSDKDCRQLLNDRVRMLNLRKQTKYGPEDLLADWGVRPEQVVDFQALVGDSVDNVPGVPKIGPKAARELLNAFDTLDGVYANLDKITAAARRKTLEEHRREAYQSRELVELKCDVPVPIDWAAVRRLSMDRPGLETLFRELGFRQLAQRILSQTDAASPERPAETVDRSNYRCVDTPELLAELVDTLGRMAKSKNAEDRWLSVDTETTSTSPTAADLVGLSLSAKDLPGVYVPVAGPSDQIDRTLPIELVRDTLGPLLADQRLAKVGQNLKYDLIVLRNNGFEVANVAFDTMVADYLCSPGDRNHSLDEMAKRYLGHTMIPITDLIGTGKSQTTFDTVDLDRATEYAAEDADVALRLLPIMQKKLADMRLEAVFHDLEMPLIQVLADMERAGIAVNRERLEELRGEFDSRIESLREQVLEAAGEEFNPDSPKQLGALLFDKLKLRVVKRTKSGPSTDVEVLQELAQEHPLPALIIEYRQASKLRSTYIDALPRMINPQTGRVHTSFRQDVAATGRLSSSEPNLQNIPIRNEDGRRIRSAFRAGPEDWLILAADYSQIELRMMAHFSGDPTLTAAFHNDEDIHAAVAAQVYGVEIDRVTREQRRASKATNFGILYGQSPFGLAKTLGIDKVDAAQFIDEYFDRFARVRDFILKTLDQARRDGYVSTMSGRRRYLNGVRDFSNLNPQQQKTLLEAERMAVNTVIQGSAADLIKMAMIRVQKRLQKSKLAATLLLQIHDELLFEVSPEAVDALTALVREEMISAATFDVPLAVDVKIGKTWADC